MTTNRIF